MASSRENDTGRAARVASDPSFRRKPFGRHLRGRGHNVYVESTDGGGHWNPVPNDLPGRDLHAFTLDPSDPKHAWAWSIGNGLFETTDQGPNWALSQSGDWPVLAAAAVDGNSALLGVSARGLATSTDGKLLYAGTTNGLKRFGRRWTEPASNGILRAGADCRHGRCEYRRACRRHEAVLPVPSPSRNSGRYREYRDEDAERLRLLVGLPQLDLSLSVAAKLATMCADGRCGEVSDELRAAIPAERSRVRRRIGELRHVDERLALLDRDLEAGQRPRELIHLEPR